MKSCSFKKIKVNFFIAQWQQARIKLSIDWMLNGFGIEKESLSSSGL